MGLRVSAVTEWLERRRHWLGRSACVALGIICSNTIASALLRADPWDIAAAVAVVWVAVVLWLDRRAP